MYLTQIHSRRHILVGQGNFQYTNFDLIFTFNFNLNLASQEWGCLAKGQPRLANNLTALADSTLAVLVQATVSLAKAQPRASKPSTARHDEPR